MEEREKELIQSVEALRDDILDFTCNLVRQKSTLGNEQTAVDMMATELEKLDFSPVRVPIQPEKLKSRKEFAPVPWTYNGRDNVLAVRAADGEGGKSVIFNGHLDVVDPEPVSFWDTDPFTPLISEGRIYGRGAADMKAGVAAMTYAVHAIDHAGFGLQAPVTIEAVIEEECCGNGALACLDAGYTADGALIPEPFGPTLLTHQLGVLWFKVIVEGKPVHVLEAPTGANAIEKLYPVIQSLRELEAKLNENGVPSAYSDIQHPINLNTGIIKGGNWPSTVPAKAELHGRLSFFPGVTYKSVCNQIEAAVQKAVQQDPWLAANAPILEFYGFRSEGHATNRDVPIFQVLNTCHKSLSGVDAESYIATCTTDLRIFQLLAKTPSTCYGPVGGNIHGANEWVDIESIVNTAKTYALFLARWCGLQS